VTRNASIANNDRVEKASRVCGRRQLLPRLPRGRRNGTRCPSYGGEMAVEVLLLLLRPTARQGLILPEIFRSEHSDRRHRPTIPAQRLPRARGVSRYVRFLFCFFPFFSFLFFSSSFLSSFYVSFIFSLLIVAVSFLLFFCFFSLFLFLFIYFLFFFFFLILFYFFFIFSFSFLPVVV
jgi:hypothetical protein